MKIVIACDVPLKPNNGTSVAAINLINALKEKGHEVRVITPDENYIGKEGYYIAKTFNLGPINNYVKKNDVTLAKPEKQIIEQALDGVDVVHVLIPFSVGSYCAKYAKKHNIAVSASFHCQAENFSSHIFLKWSRIANHIIYNVFWDKTYKYVDIIHYPTEFIRNLFEKAIHRKTNGRAISNGVGEDFEKRNVSKPEELKDKIVILFIGRYSKEKNHRLLIDSVNYSKYSNKIQLIFAGSGPLKDKLFKYSNKKLINQPIFNFYNHKDLINVINYSDLYVHASDIEIEAIACLEAIKCGLVPIINNSPKSAAKNFAIEENNLFNYNDPKDLAKKIDYWIDHPEEKVENSTKYLGYTKQFDRNKCMDEMVKLVEDAYIMKYEKQENNIL